MEKFVIVAIPVMLSILYLRTLALPLRLMGRVGVHALLGFVCLWLMNALSGFTGVTVPVNWVTALVAGMFGAPGVGFLTVWHMTGTAPYLSM